MKPLTHFGTRLRAAEGWSHRATEPWSGHGPSWLSTWREHTASLDSAYPQPEHLKQRYGELFGAEFDVLLYDLTSTYVEGACHDNPMMRRGYSRDSIVARRAPPQICFSRLLVST